MTPSSFNTEKNKRYMAWTILLTTFEICMKCLNFKQAFHLELAYVESKLTLIFSNHHSSNQFKWSKALILLICVTA